MTNVVIAGYARSAFAPAKKGALARVRPDELAAEVVRALVMRTGVAPEDIEDMIVGCAFPEGEQGLNVARLIGLLAELPLSVAGMTVNRFCGSSMQSIHMAAGAIQMNAGEVFLCAGVESMSRVPMSGFNPHAVNPSSTPPCREPISAWAIPPRMSRSAGRSPVPQQEEFALASHRKAAAAQATGVRQPRSCRSRNGKVTVERDGCIRADTTAEVLAGLKPAFDQDGTVTAGTSSPLTDGAVGGAGLLRGVCAQA